MVLTNFKKLIVVRQLQFLLAGSVASLMNRAGLSYRAPASTAMSNTIRNVPTVLLKFDGLAFCPKRRRPSQDSHALLILRNFRFSNSGHDLSNAAIRSSRYVLLRGFNELSSA